jgi:hypothetical protein
MRKTLTALVAAATLAAATLATSTSADAQWRWRGGWRGPAFWGGIAAGALIGTALAAPYYGNYGYYGYPRSYAYGYPTTSYSYYGWPYTYGGYAYAGYSGYTGYADTYAYAGGPYYNGYTCSQRSWNGYRWVRYRYAC